jgi:hypothetical protein
VVSSAEKSMRDLPNQFLREQFGLGSSTRGKTMDEQNMGRSEAEFRAEREAKLMSKRKYAMKTPQEASARMALIWALSKTNLKIPENLLIQQNWKWDDCNRHMYANTDGDKYIFYILAVAQNVSIAVLSVYDRNGKVTWEADIPEHITSRRKLDEYWLNVWINTKDGSLVSELMFFSEADALENITAGYAGMTYLHTVHSLRRASGNIWDTWAIDMSDEAEAIAQDAECERRHNV